MRTRIAVPVVVALLAALGTAAPARAQRAFYEIDVGRAAVAFWEDHEAQRFAFALAGQGVIYNADTGQPQVGDVGCAAVGNADRATFGCGELAAFSIDNDLGTAAGKGSFDAIVFEFETGKMTRRGKVSFDLAWTASGDPTPRGGGGYFVDGTAVGLGGGAEIARDASRGVKGRVTRSPLGRGPATLVDAAILMGYQGFLEIYG